MSPTLIKSLDALMLRLQESCTSGQIQLMTEFEPQWLSACQTSEPDPNGMIHWQPVWQDPPGDFSDVEAALEMELHPDLLTYYSRYWSAEINAQSARGNLQLLMAWNPDDFERLQQNLIGHILMKKRLKQAITLFFAVTDEDDWIIALDNQSGAVVLEQVGCEPKEVLAKDLATFLDQLQPVAEL